MPPNQKGRLKLLDIKRLIPHEDVSEKRLKNLKEILIDDGVLKRPVIVDDTSLVILDGHHRCQALLDLGYRYIPILLVRYYSSMINIYRWRRNIEVSKESVIERGQNGNLYPNRTSRHILLFRIPYVNVRLESLK